MKTQGTFAVRQNELSAASRDADDRNKYVGQDGGYPHSRKRKYVRNSTRDLHGMGALPFGTWGEAEPLFCG
jgi:hypothetical protein